jgi:hypothetical protein
LFYASCFTLRASPLLRNPKGREAGEKPTVLKREFFARLPALWVFNGRETTLGENQRAGKELSLNIFFY